MLLDVNLPVFNSFQIATETIARVKQIGIDLTKGQEYVDLEFFVSSFQCALTCSISRIIQKEWQKLKYIKEAIEIDVVTCTFLAL